MAKRNNMAEQVEQSLHPEVVSARAGDRINKLLIAHDGEPVLVLLSGGSALDVLTGVDPDLFGGNVTVGLVDERISPHPGDRNGASEKLKAFLSDCRAHMLPIRQGVTPETSAAEFDGALHAWKDKNRDGFTLVVQGIGPDGHTAGIMPFPKNPSDYNTLFEGNTWAVGYDAKEKSPFRFRVTLTNTFLRNEADATVVYAVGPNKLSALSKVFAPSGSLAATPARIIREMPNVFLFTDQRLPV